MDVHMEYTREEILEDLYVRIPCRRQQIDILASLFGEEDDSTVPSVFIYGHTGTGKSEVTNCMMKQFELTHIVVDCVECYTSRLFYECIINAVAGHTPERSNGYSPYARCDNLNDMVRMLKQLLAGQTETFYIILDKAERLRDMEVNVLPGMLRLQELSDLNISVILLSEIVWEKFRCGTGFIEPLVLHFPDYSRDELLEIMCLDHSSQFSVDFYKTYCNLLLSVFHMACRNLTELRHLAILNFRKYYEPIMAGEAAIDDTRKLWRHIEPHLKKALQTVYLREISSAQWEAMQEANTETQQTHGLSARMNVELPFYSKYLLIAAYLASYNPAKSDKRFFMKHAGKTSKRVAMNQQKRSERTTNQLLGPKPFPLDRLMAIFYSIVEAKVTPTANIFNQIASLASLNLLCIMSGADQIESPKYKCLVSLEFIRGISRTVNFDVIQYLYDFV